MDFSKPPKTYQEQVQILKDRGLIVADEARALHLLEHHNYYRLSAYRFPFTLAGNPDRFLPGTTFEALWNLYHFDRTLRQFVSEALKRVEISVRSRWAYVLAHAYGPNAYENPLVFRDPVRHTDALNKVDSELRRSHEDFVEHYRKKYEMVRPPIWAACEVMTFGLISKFYENMARDKDKKKIASRYDLSIDMLGSLLTHGSYVRNLCAHHARLWNRRFTITVQLPKHKPAAMAASLNSAEDRRLYNTIVFLIHMMSVIDPDSAWAERLTKQLLSMDAKLILHMGFPADWKTRPLWKESV